jgi:hypothetical protein
MMSACRTSFSFAGVGNNARANRARSSTESERFGFVTPIRVYLRRRQAGGALLGTGRTWRTSTEGRL